MKKQRISVNMTCTLCREQPPLYYVRGTGQCCHACMLGVTQLSDYPRLQEGLAHEIERGHVIRLIEEAGWKGFVL